MDIIHLLPDSVANQIAAGEVIQRPASCLKELVENALDAGADNIQILLYDAGRTIMQVIDNGKGMSETDARMAFERHATSKIQSAQDLFALRTMGFRGEALASICAVAQVELQTRRAEDEMGTRLEINGSEVVAQEPCQCAVGANFKVKNLFFNVPARRRFLKTDATELRNVLTEFYRIALVNPGCQFTLVNNDEILLELPAGSTKQRIEQVFGKSQGRLFTSALVDIKSDTELVSIRGFVCKPESATKTAQQFFFVNNRYMRHPYFHKAVMTAYQGMLQADHNPSYFIYFDINPEAIDVNIHPTKTEIKFADEQSIWQILLATVREALGKFTMAPSIDFDQEAAPEIPVAPTDTTTVKHPDISFDPTYNPFSQPSTYTPEWKGKPVSTDWSSHKVEGSWAANTQSAASRATSGWQQLYEISKEVEEPIMMQLFDEELSAVTPYQYAGRYIILPSRKGLLMVDQHRAHLCVRYRQLRTMLQEHHGMTQSCLFPEVVDLSPDDMQLVLQLDDDLRSVGFDLSRFSHTSVAINGVPAMLGDENPAASLQNILSAVREAGVSAAEKWKDRIALALAEDTAIRNGRQMSVAEMQDLLQQLFSLDSCLKTPNGKTVFAVMPDSDIEKLF